MLRSILLAALFLFISFESKAQTELWSLELEATAFSPTLYPSAANADSVLISVGNELKRINAQGQVAWSIEHDRALQSSPTSADLDGDGTFEIAVADANGYVFVYDAKGALQWSHDFDTPTGAFKHIVAVDVHPNPNLELLIGFDDGWLNCLSAGGKLLWRFFGDKFRVGGIAVGDVTGDGFTDIVYCTDNGHVYCLDGWGYVQWRYEEYAPYGRSGPNLVDLNGDGAVEVLLTRSNQGTATCQMALNGKTGAFKWRAPTYMQGYTSNAIADLDGDGSLEVVHGDKGNHLNATRADGSQMWEVILEGRGIFWASAIADVDGDGALDILVGVRRNSAKDKPGLYRISADGRVLDELLIGSGANTSPAIADLNGDGKLEVIVASDSPNRLVALTWNKGGKVAWPSVRGGSAMRGTSVALGEPLRDGDKSDVGSLHIEDHHHSPMLGPRAFLASWQENLRSKGSFIVLSYPIVIGAVEHRVIPVNHDERSIEFDVSESGLDRLRLTVSLHPPDGTTVGSKTVQRNVLATVPRFNELLGDRLSQLQSIAETSGADMSGLANHKIKLDLLASELERLRKTNTEPAAIADATDALREYGNGVLAFFNICSNYLLAGHTGPFAAWQDSNPWDETFWPPITDNVLQDSISVVAFRDEFEDAAINLVNLTSEPIDIRCTFTRPVFDQRPEQNPDLANRITLRRGIAIPKRGGGTVLDALPELDRSGVISLAPLELRQLWLVFDTHGLDDGEYDLNLYLGSMTHPPTVRTIPIKLKVWQVQLPEGVYAQMNWGHIDPVNTSDQDLQSMLDHGVSVANAPALPALPVDEHGNANGEADWTTFDATLARVPDYFQLMFHGAMRPQWPASMDAAAIEAASDNAFASGVQTMSEHLLSLGWDYDRWAFYHLDEPWLTGLTVIPELRAFCERVRAVDPRVRLYANPTGKLKVEYLEEFKDLIDVWQPEINFLKRDPELLAWFQENAKTLWAYEATDPGKELLPLGYYRGLGWLAWDLKLSGAGFWVYKYHDLWWPLDVGNWAVVYPSGDEVVPSRRWEACRDGQEDYRAMYVLREEIQKARDGHRLEDADRAEKLLDEAVEKVVGWQIGVIDEITRQTRDYEIDYQLLLEYRTKIAEMIIDLRAGGAHNPIHFLGD